MNSKSSLFTHWRHQGEHWIWLNAMAIALCVIMVIGLLLLIMVRGLGYFWPSDLVQYQYSLDNQQLLISGEIVAREEVVTDSGESKSRVKLKVGNRDIYPLDFLWIWDDSILSTQYPKDLIAIEREEWGNFYGYFDALVDVDNTIKQDSNLQQLIVLKDTSDNYRKRIAKLINSKISSSNARLEKLRLKRRGYQLKNALTPEISEQIALDEAQITNSYKEAEAKVIALEQAFALLGGVRIRTADGQLKVIPLSQIYKVWQPNSMSLLDKTLAYFGNILRFLSEYPREANTEGGIFPVIFGTVVMVFLMTIFTTPMGVIAAIYIREYAPQGRLIRLVRICVNNLAGVPSVVYGVFGLGFFVYFMGGSIDKLFYPEALPSPTFGSPGLLWASLTLALLTLPVVIVSAEEGFARIPISVREGSMALGATKFETIYKVLLPMSTPAIMTGVILAIARAAGEVAPLMLVGVVKLAPDLVIDSTSPFIHLDRKFMHLGFHIFDVGFQSPNVDATTPLVYATAFLLLLVILLLNLTAILVRNRLREKYKLLDI